MTLLAPVAATLPPQTVTLATPSGTTSAADSASAGAPSLALLVQNTSGAARNLLINTPNTVYGTAVPDISVPLPTNGVTIVKLPADLADTTGVITFGVDNVTGVSYRPVTL